MLRRTISRQSPTAGPAAPGRLAAAAEHVAHGPPPPSRSLLSRFSLAQRFAVVCLAVLVAGALIIGELVSREIESGVIARTGDVTALYVDSFVAPHLAGLATGEGISGADSARLAALLDNTPLGHQIVSFKVWSLEGEVVFSTHPEQVGERFPFDDHRIDALVGKVSSEISTLAEEENRWEREHWSRLVETYTPYRAPNGTVAGVVEFYQLPDDLLGQVRDSQRKGWFIVGASTVAMYVLLVGLVGGGSRTIARQTQNLRESFDQQVALERRIRGLNQRLRRAAGAKAQTDEQLLQRIAQELHDGPAQDLALALLRLESADRPDASEEQREAFDTMHFAVRHALDEVRGISTGLHLPQLNGLGWREIIEKAATEHQQRTRALVHIDAASVESPPTNAQRIAAYRVVQEALSNASRHAGTSEQWVSLGIDEEDCVVTIRDNGKGFDVASPKPPADRRPRLGLQGMRERIELLGGEFAVISSPGRGTTVTARIPMMGVEG